MINAPNLKEIRIPGPGGYDIPLLTRFDDEETIIIICHGLGSSKSSPTGQRIDEAARQSGLGTLRFDFPGHGDSPKVGQPLLLSDCLADLAAVEDWLHRQAPKSKIAYFASSFGGYIMLLYLAQRPNTGRRAYLRCAAVSLPEKFFNEISPEQRARLEQEGRFTIDLDCVHPLVLTPALFQELAENDVFQKYPPGSADLFMIHGDQDTDAPYAAAKRFATLADADFVTVPGCGHRFNHPNEMDVVVETALLFFLNWPD